MTDTKPLNILPNFPQDSDKFKHVPIIGDKTKIKKEREKESIRTMMNNPEIQGKLNHLAEELNKNFNSFTKVLVDIRAGATVLDTINNKLYTYEYFATPFVHNLQAKMIMEFAGKPFYEFDEADSHFFILYETGISPSPRFIMTALDFCKYVACTIFIVQDMNVKDEKEFLKDIL